MNKKRKNNYIIDVPYNNYFFNSIDNGSTNITHRIVSRFSTELKKKQRLNESSTIPVTHTRVSSQPFNEAYQPKKKVIKNLNYTINLNEDNIDKKKIKSIAKINKCSLNKSEISKEFSIFKTKNNF